MRGLDKVGLELVLDNLVCSISLEITVLLILRSEASGGVQFSSRGAKLFLQRHGVIFQAEDILASLKGVLHL